MYSGKPDQGQTTASDASCFNEVRNGAFSISNGYFKLSIIILMGYFGLRLLFLAIYISPLIPPDEITHFGICEIFSRVPFLPSNSPASYQFGLVTNIPWLYYWIMGKLLALNFTWASDLLFLRLLNIPLAFAFVFFVWRTLTLITDDRLSQILVITAMTNTMMLTFLSAFVSYDNLTNLLAAMSVYYLLFFFENRSASMLMLSILCQLAGCLTKFTFLPLALALTCVLLVHESKNLRELTATILAFVRNPTFSAIMLTLAILIGMALNTQLYGGNYIRYGAVTLETTDVLPLEHALKYRLTARGYIFNLFKEGQISREKALEMTSLIPHSGDRSDAVFMIENYTRLKNGENHIMGLPEYIPLWVERMAAGVFGIFAHLQIANNWPNIAPIAILALMTLLAFVLRWRPRDANCLTNYMAVIAIFYTVVLLYLVNYREYLSNGAPFVALQGRYIFPVLGLIYVLSSYYLMQLFKGRTLRMTLFVMAVIIFIMCDFPLFIAKVTPDWTYWPPS